MEAVHRYDGAVNQVMGGGEQRVVGCRLQTFHARLSHSGCAAGPGPRGRCGAAMRGLTQPFKRGTSGTRSSRGVLVRNPIGDLLVPPTHGEGV